MKNIICVFSIFFVISFLPIICFESKALVLIINNIHTPFLDQMSKIFTFMGSLWMYIIFLITLILYNRSFTDLLFAGLSCFITCIFIQLLKYFIIKTRPINSMMLVDLYLPINYIPDYSNSFPSGHAAIAFVLTSVITCLFFLEKLQYLQIPAIVVSYCIALTRVYLCMHFYEDIYIGAIIGTFCTLITYFIIIKYIWPPCHKYNFISLLIEVYKKHKKKILPKQ